ncbi:MAG: hypothetical protein N2645_19040 [Clostridia bacterium]|nr:hypothetical protein [Clostridia bacterium]
MFFLGEKFKMDNKEVIALVTSGDEVLVFVEKGVVKWVNSSILEPIYPEAVLIDQ